jgi:hypothetical protein
MSSVGVIVGRGCPGAARVFPTFTCGGERKCVFENNKHAPESPNAIYHHNTRFRGFVALAVQSRNSLSAFDADRLDSWIVQSFANACLSETNPTSEHG